MVFFFFSLVNIIKKVNSFSSDRKKITQGPLLQLYLYYLSFRTIIYYYFFFIFFRSCVVLQFQFCIKFNNEDHLTTKNYKKNNCLILGLHFKIQLFITQWNFRLFLFFLRTNVARLDFFILNNVETRKSQN